MSSQKPTLSSTNLFARTVGATGLVVVLTALSGLTLAAKEGHSRQTQVPSVESSARAFASGPALGLVGASDAIAEAAEKALPAVVNIATNRRSRSDGSTEQERFLRRFFGSPRERVEPRVPRFQSLGSGVLVDPSGIVLTNNHVIEEAAEIRVTLSDGSEFAAEVVGADAPTDLAVIQLVGVGDRKFSSFSLGNDDELRLGEIVLAVGNPFGLSGSVTMGIVSAKGRGNVGIVDYEDFIQTDAAINPGNSGGALLNLKGDLVGINTAIASRSGGNQGVGFAVPASLARQIMTRLQTDGVVRRSWLGVAIQPFTPSIAKAFDAEGVTGVLVSGVQGDSPASRAGLLAGDVILNFGARTVDSPSELRNKVALSAAGKPLDLEIWRDGSRKKLKVKLSLKDSTIHKKGRFESSGNPCFGGAELENLEGIGSSTRRELGLALEPRGGVLVRFVDPASSLSSSGLLAGDVIVEINRRKIASLKDLSGSCQELSGPLAVRVLRGEDSIYLLLD